MRNSESCHPERSGSKAAAQSKDLLRRSRPEARISPLHSTSIGVLLTAILAVASLSAQKPAERAFADSIVALAQSAELAAVSAANARCAGHTDDLARLCHGLLAERKAELTLQRDDAINASDMLTRSVADSPKSPEAWYGLGLVRLQLARDTVFSKGGPLLPVGASNELGAANALVYALKLDPTFAAAANALATTAMPRESSGALKDRVDMLRKVRGILSPGSLAAVAFLERKTGHVDTALALERRALASGKVDSGLIDVAMARDLYRLGKPDEGRKVLIAGAGINTDVAYKAYRQELAWVANPEELAEWDTLPPEHRSAWLADFWAKRDIAEGRADGERLIEHYRRIEYAMVHFPITLPQTGRQRLMSYTPSMGYFEEQQARKCAMRAPDAYPELARLAFLSNTIGSDDPHAYYHPIQDQIDDRGVVWIRHGKPAKRLSDFGSEAIEIWRYERPEGPLVLQFREADFEGSVGANTLVPTLLTVSLGQRNHICALETSLCGVVSQRLSSGAESTAAVPIARTPRQRDNAAPGSTST